MPAYQAIIAVVLLIVGLGAALSLAFTSAVTSFIVVFNAPCAHAPTDGCRPSPDPLL
jgi:hypothetical protein